MSKTDPTIKQNIAKLELLMEWFDSDYFDVEEAIKKFDEAKKLADTIKQQLADVENTVTVIKSQAD